MVKIIKSMTESVKKRLGWKPNLPRVSVGIQEKLRHTDANTQQENDAKCWDDYFNDGRATREKVLIMKRIFALIQMAGLETDGSKPNPDSLSLNLASILSHGGRLVIQVPPLGEDSNANPNALTDAILTGIKMEGNVDKRSFASHSLTIENDSVSESLLKTTGLRGNYLSLMKDFVKGRHYGMNIGVGYNGAQAEDGTNGHVYFFWQAPTKTSPGGLMVGVETAEANKTNPYGATHGAGAVKGEFSSTGGTKFTSEPFKKHSAAGLMLSHDGGLMLNLTSDDMKRLPDLEHKATAINLAALKEPVNINARKLQDKLSLGQKRESVSVRNKPRHVFESLDTYIASIDANEDLMQLLGSRNGYESILNLMKTLDKPLLDSINSNEDKGFQVKVKDTQFKAPLVLFPTNIALDPDTEKKVFSVFQRSAEKTSLTLHFDKAAPYSDKENAKWAKIEVDRFLRLSGSVKVEIIGELPGKFVEAVVEYCAVKELDCTNKSTFPYQQNPNSVFKQMFASEKKATTETLSGLRAPSVAARKVGQGQEPERPDKEPPVGGHP